METHSNPLPTPHNSSWKYGDESASADFRRGLTACESSDYATALREWKPLAEQGDAAVQSNLG